MTEFSVGHSGHLARKPQNTNQIQGIKITRIRMKN